MIERIARLGYISIGIVYALVGLLALAAALGQRASAGGQSEAMRLLLDQPFGRTILGIIALGLGGYTLWRIMAAFSDSETEGSDAKGIATRLFSVLRGLLYGSLAIEIARTALPGGHDGGGAQTRHWTSRALQHAGGRAALAIAGLAAVAYGASQLHAAWGSRLNKHLHLGGLDASVRRKIVAISRFGIAARGIVLFLIGGSFVIAALHHNASEAQDTAGALKTLPLSMLGIVGAGFVAYGLYALVNARYRQIRT